MKYIKCVPFQEEGSRIFPHNVINFCHTRINIIFCILILILCQLTLYPIDEASAGNIIKIPIRWCGVIGAPSMQNPAVVGEATPHDVMWRRHERPSDQIFIPQAEITFRSGYTTATTPPTFPVIADPQPTPGNAGDVRSDDNFAEFLTLINNCRQQWQTNPTTTNVIGITSLHINQFVDVNGNPSDTWGLGGVGIHSNTASQNIAGRAMMLDNSYVLQTCGVIWPSVDSKLVGHEYGHAVSLMHGNGIDDDADGDLDEDNLPAPNGDGIPDEPGDSLFNSNLMQYQTTCTNFANAIALTTGGTVSQRGWSRDQALLHIPDREVDPVLSPLSSMKVDKVGELPREKYLDIDAVLVAVDVRRGSTSFALSTFGLIPKPALNTTLTNQPLNTTLNYYFLADLDNNPITGGQPAKLGIPSGFQGAELVGSVTVGLGNKGNYISEPTTWIFDRGQFIETVRPNNIQSEVLTDRVTITPAPGKRLNNYSQDIANIITLTISNELRGLISDSIRLEAVSENPLTGAVDVANGNFTLIQPSFPVCQVEPSAGRPGNTFVVHATGLVPNSDVHAILGDEEVAKGVTDSVGNVFLQFRAADDTTSGVRLMTVGTAALTADCTLKIIPSEILGQNTTAARQQTMEQ
jgi:hypothetical protein